MKRIFENGENDEVLYPSFLQTAVARRLVLCMTR
jgi:hypothetical protein